MSDYRNKANIFSVFFFGLGIVFLLPVFFTPLWQIKLEAPQYPEGLTMFIYHNNVQGENENDLENINLLNHYIGMKKIEPDSIPELQYMKYVIGGLIALGFLVLVIRRKRWMMTWVITACLVGAAGIYDLNRWEEDYGRDLDPMAPIKVEGMVYKPPLLGEKQLLNITATSYPQVGGFCFVFSVFICAMSVYMAHKQPVHEHEDDNHDNQKNGTQTHSGNSHSVKSNIPVVPFCMLSLLLLAACSREPDPIEYGKDLCAHCSMLISDSRFGSEMVSVTGKKFKFDSAECLVHYVNKKNTTDIHSSWVTDFEKSGQLIPAEKAFYLVSSALPSPMGANLSAFASEKNRSRHMKLDDDLALSWTALRKHLDR